MEEKINAYNILVRHPERKRPLGRPRRRWENDIRMYLREIGWESVDAPGSGLRPEAGHCEHDNEISSSIKGGEFD
jgi:hypothetical protein